MASNESWWEWFESLLLENYPSEIGIEIEDCQENCLEK